MQISSARRILLVFVHHLTTLGKKKKKGGLKTRSSARLTSVSLGEERLTTWLGRSQFFVI